MSDKPTTQDEWRAALGDKGYILILADMEAGRLAKGLPTALTHEQVKVTCWACGGVNVFPVHFDQPRPTPAPCCHCGVSV